MGEIMNIESNRIISCLINIVCVRVRVRACACVCVRVRACACACNAEVETNAMASVVHTFIRPHLWDTDYGTPVARCQESGNGTRIFTREWTKASIQWDCNTGHGEITVKPL